MKYAIPITCLLFSIIAVAQQYKPYAGVQVEINSTWVNQHNLRIIEATSSYANQVRHFTFGCNENNDSCQSPMVGGSYQIKSFTPSEEIYRCDNYGLKPFGQSPIIAVCLENVD